MPTLSTSFEADTSQFGDAVEQLAKLVDQRTQDMSDNIARIHTASDKAAGDMQGVKSSLDGILKFAGAPVQSLAAALGIDYVADKVKALLDSFQQIEQLASRTGQSTDQVQAQQFALNVSGVSASDTNGGLQHLSQLLADAVANNNILKQEFDANNVALTDSNGKLVSMSQLLTSLAGLFANAIGPVRSQLAQALGLSQNFADALGQGPAKFEALVAGAQEAGAVIDKDMVAEAAEFDRQWDASTVRFKAGFKGAIVEIGQLIGQLGPQLYDALNVGGILDAIAGAIERSFGGLRGMTDDELEAAKAAAQLAHNLGEVQRIQDEMGRRAGVITIHPQAQPTGAPTKLAHTDPNEGTSRYEREVAALNKHVAAMEADTLGIGKNEAALQTLRAELGLLQAAERDGENVTNAQIEAYTKYRATMSAQQALSAAGIKLNADQAASFEQVTGRVNSAATALMQSQYAFRAVQDAAKALGQDMADVFENMETHAKKGSEEIKSILQSLNKDLLQAVFTGSGPFAQLLGFASQTPGATGGIFGAFASMFSGFHAAGGNIPAGQFGVTGEAGPEIVTGPATVIPVSRMNSSSSSSANINVTVNNPTGNMEVQSMVHRGVAAGLGAYDKALPGRLAELQRRNG
jgi:hypothetical protein